MTTILQAQAAAPRMTRMLQHYRIGNAQIGVAEVAILALRCADCSTDFHIYREPRFCPNCGVEVSCVITFGAGAAR